MAYRDDAYYIDQVLGGNSGAYRQLVEKHQDLVFTIVHRIIRSSEEAEEVAQDVFIKAYHSLGEFRGKSKFSTWLYRIAYNAAVSHSRKKKVEFLSMEENGIENYSEEHLPQEFMGLNIHEQQKLINDALSTLPRTDNLIITLFYFHTRELSEIADIIGMTQNNVKVKLHRIRKKLLKEMTGLLEKRMYIA